MELEGEAENVRCMEESWVCYQDLHRPSFCNMWSATELRIRPGDWNWKTCEKVNIAYMISLLSSPVCFQGWHWELAEEQKDGMVEVAWRRSSTWSPGNRERKVGEATAGGLLQSWRWTWGIGIGGEKGEWRSPTWLILLQMGFQRVPKVAKTKEFLFILKLSDKNKI